ncbi:MAG TPA: hypothetical protein DCS63_00805 [Elusimicrobia bacterium]|nr:hypothetical protein [Elusimicrobiota bacterium]
MKIVAGIINAAEAEYFSARADELYFGVPQIENHRKWYDWQHIRNIRDVEKIIKIAHKNGKKIYLAANEMYRPESYGRLVKSVKQIAGLGVDGLIVRDVFLLDYFNKEGPPLDLVLSSTAVCFNSKSLDFFAQFNVSRAVIPQHLPPEECKHVLAGNRRLKYEIFYFPDCFCPNIDGICPYHDINKVKNPRNCNFSFKINGKTCRMEKPSGSARRGMIYDFYKLKVDYIKMARDGGFKEKKAVFGNIKRMLELLEGDISRGEFVLKTGDIM